MLQASPLLSLEVMDAVLMVLLSVCLVVGPSVLTTAAPATCPRHCPDWLALADLLPFLLVLAADSR